MRNRLEALMMARELESYQAVGTAKIASLICGLVKDLELAEQEIDSLQERVKQLEIELMVQGQ
jgi:hypothetical protein